MRAATLYQVGESRRDAIIVLVNGAWQLESS